MGLFSRFLKAGKAAIQTKVRDVLQDDESETGVSDDLAEEIARSRARAQERARVKAEVESRTANEPHEANAPPLASPKPVVSEDVQVTERDGSKRSL